MSKREEILKSSLELFATKGYENVGIQKIVTSVEVTKPTLYHYFGSKQGLLDSVLDFYFSPFLNDLKSCSSYSGDIIFTLEAIAKDYFSFAKTHPEISRFILSLIYSSAESEARKTVQPYIDREFEIVESVFKLAEADHGNMKGRSCNFTTTFLGMITSYITSFLNGKSDIDDEKAHEACRQFMYGIFS